MMANGNSHVKDLSIGQGRAPTAGAEASCSGTSGSGTLTTETSEASTETAARSPAARAAPRATSAPTDQ